MPDAAQTDRHHPTGRDDPLRDIRDLLVPNRRTAEPTRASPPGRRWRDVTIPGAGIIDVMPDAVVLPGRMYGPEAPLLMYSGDAAERRGATVHRHLWSPDPPPPFEPEIEGWVCADIAPLLGGLAGRPLLIGKSMGTNAARLAADRGLSAIWLTPLLTLPWIVAALERATAPYLLVGGTADGSWDGAVARRLSTHILEVPNADHGMYVPGPLTESITALGRVVVGVQEFLDTIGWPG